MIFTLFKLLHPDSVLWYSTCTMNVSLAYVPVSSFVYIPFIFADSTSCQFAVALCDGFPTFVLEIV